MKKNLVFLFVLLVALVSSNPGDLFIVVTEVTEMDVLEMYTLKLDQKGNTELVTGNFRYLTGESVTADGVSVFDQDEDVMYYTTDSDSTFIYSMDVNAKMLLSPISLGARAIIKMNYDTVDKRLIFTILNSQNVLSMISYSQTSGYFILNSLISRFRSDAYIDGTIDAFHQIYYMIYANVSSFGIAKFSTATMNSAITTHLLNCAVPNLVVNYISYDPVRLTLFGVGSTFAPSLKYHLITIHPTTFSCSSSLIATKEFGIGTAFSYNPKTHLLYMGWAPNGPGKFYTIDVLTGMATGTALLDGMVITDIEVEF